MSTLNPAFCSFPIMASGNMDYLEGNSYSVQLYSDVDVRRIEHKLSGQSWVRSLIDDGSAQFACIVTAPWCSYRSVVAKSVTRTSNDMEIVVEQEVDLATAEYAGPAMLQPIVVVCQELRGINLSEEDGVNALWLGSEIDVPRGAKIAYGPCYHASEIMQSILRVRVDGNLPDGCFEVIDVPEEGFYFSLNSSKDLFDKLKNPGRSTKHRDSIYCFALSQGLEILKNEYEEETTWRIHGNLRHLHDYLKQKGLSTWDQEDFKPNRVVAQWVPHQIDRLEND